MARPVPSLWDPPGWALCARAVVSDTFDPVGCGPPGPSVPGVLQTLEWAAVSYAGGLPNPGVEPTSVESLSLAGRFLTTCTTRVGSPSF